MAKFKIGGWKDRRGGAQGTPQVKIDGWNAELEILTAYYRSGSQEDNPDVVCVKANAIDESWRQTEYIPASELTTKKLQQLFPRLYYHGRGKTDIGGIVRSQLYQGLDNGTVRKGFLFDELGSNTLPDRKTVFIRGDEIIGDIDRPYFLTEDTNRYHLLGEKNSVGNLISLLLTAPVQVLLMLAFTLLASVRSILVDAGIALQALMVITGKQGMGKTTLATRIGGVYQDKITRRTAGVIQVGGSFSSICESLFKFRDSLVILDDLCLSASSMVQRNTLDTAAKVVRTATGNIPWTKKSGNKTVEIYSQALAVITAEYSFSNMSDLTRCIINPIKEPLYIADALTPNLVGAAIRHFSKWISDNSDVFTAAMKSASKGEEIKDFDQRICTNYCLLVMVWSKFLDSLKPLEVADEVIISLNNKMIDAINVALSEHRTLIDGINNNVKRGNVSYIILGLLDAKQLKPGKHYLADKDEREQRYYERNCICLKNGDIGIEPEYLLQLVHAQPGYRDFTKNKLTSELKDCGALVIQRNGKNSSNQVKLWGGGPWGYRLRLDELKDSQQEYT